jgi:flagellar hook-basal body complex protein FliE
MSGSTSAGVIRVDATADIGELEANLSRAAQLVNGYVAQTNRAAAATQAQSAANDNATRSTGRFGQAMGQAGFQVQDFASQVAGGQSALLAFGQQASQLLGIFGTGGAIAGAILTVGVLVTQLVQLKTAGEEAAKAQEELAKALNKAEDAMKSAGQRSIETLNREREAARALLGTSIGRDQTRIEELNRAADAARDNAARLRRAGLSADDPSVRLAQELIERNRREAEALDRRIIENRERERRLQGDFQYEEAAGPELPREERSRGGSGRAAPVPVELGPSVADFVRSQDAARQAVDAVRNSLDPAAAAAAEYERTLRTLNDASELGQIGQEDFADLLGRAQQRLEQASRKTQDFADIGREFGVVFTSAFDGIVTGSQSAAEALEKFGLGIAKILERAFITKPLEAGANALFDLAKPVLSDFFGGLFRANGGPVTAGSPYIVGERGPELFVPGASGQIVPNGAFGGGGVNISIDARGAEQGVEARIDAVLARRLPGIISASKSSLMADVNRGGSAAQTFGRR